MRNSGQAGQLANQSGLVISSVSSLSSSAANNTFNLPKVRFVIAEIMTLLKPLTMPYGDFFMAHTMAPVLY